MRRSLTHLLLFATLVLGATPARAAVESYAPEGILQLFDSADVVLLSERPWSKLDSDLRNAVVQQPDLTKRVDDIVIEFANALHQDVLDAYILDLKPVPVEELRLIWRDTTQPGTWESPVYEEFIEAVRKVNRYKPREDRVRLVAGDPPIDWSKISGWPDTAPYRDRHGFVVEVIGREVLKKKRKALVIYHSDDLPRSIEDRRGNVTTRLEQSYPEANVTVVATVPDRSQAVPDLQKSIEFSRRPTLVKLDRSSIGMWPAKSIFEGVPGSLRQMADGLVFMGHIQDRPLLPPADATRDTAYVRELRRRHRIVGR